jgi:hypothetical protein
LVRRQSDLLADTNRSGLTAGAETAKLLTDRQQALKEQAEQLCKRLEKIDKPASGPTEAPPDSEPPDTNDAKPGSCAGPCRSASGAMASAQEHLSQDKPERSLQDMDRAILQLRAAQTKLDELMREAGRRLLALPFEQQAREQENTLVDTDHVARDMEEHDKGRGEVAKPTPGKRNVQQAVPKQKAAAGQLKQSNASKAKQEQQDALEQLEQARKLLEDALAQLRQELQDELLRSLEERFGAMLTTQQELSICTRAAHELSENSSALDRDTPAEVAQRCSTISIGEAELAGEASDALKLLEQEGSTAAFPMIVEDLRNELSGVAERLARSDSGPRTQSLQAAIEETLKDLIDALRRRMEEEDGGQGGQCNGQPPLVPMSAELKLVLLQQQHVNRRTRQYDEAVPEHARMTEEARLEAADLSRKQGRVEELMRLVAIKHNKESPAGK